MNKVTLNKTTLELIRKAYETGKLTDAEFRYVISDMLVGDGYILGTGTTEHANAEIVLRLRLRGKDKKLRKAFWK